MRSADFFSILLQMILINRIPSNKTCGYYFFSWPLIQRSHYIDTTYNTTYYIKLLKFSALFEGESFSRKYGIVKVNEF